MEVNADVSASAVEEETGNCVNEAKYNFNTIFAQYIPFNYYYFLLFYAFVCTERICPNCGGLQRTRSLFSSLKVIQAFTVCEVCPFRLP